MKTQQKKWAVVIASTLAAVTIGQATGITNHFPLERNVNTEDAFDMYVNAVPEDELKRQIEDKAEEYKVEPIDAKVDRVWKAIPGYNGMEVDVQATYLQARSNPNGASIPLVYKQIPPKVTLDDLGAQPIYRGNPEKKMASFMINVAWGNEYIVPMLDILDEYKIRATFFLDGSWLKKNEQMAKEIQKRGHELENHAYSHPNMSQLTTERATLEISKTKSLLKEMLGVENKWFAPPSGDYDQETVELARQQGLKTVLWTIDTVDWKKPSPDSVVAKITKGVEPGSLILMHPTASSAGAMRGMIEGITKKGIKLGTVSETLSSERLDVPES
ncbi:polysaccharide deacetylase family protein [Paenibacillus sp. PDC88]|uniref:polysaccharide deacetylase family protein n=1 Tax=Paenibacillus sp. PDC88 TaxID=1884375 RepID=UPI0008959731|nr:polysaccharide deacetylase family protein [Paenibacillus sp. PDC88]SDW14926.1 probable sporulation protein, polysaccharide deacetylase family [Paenibacillus sp. PDC88]